MKIYSLINYQVKKSINALSKYFYCHFYDLDNENDYFYFLVISFMKFAKSMSLFDKPAQSCVDIVT